MKKFLIKYKDPDTQEIVEVVKEFDDFAGSDTVGSITAEEWAEDFAYTAADKGYHEVKEIKC